MVATPVYTGGALTALIGVAELPDSQLVRTIEYLQAVARKAQLDFIPQQRQRPVASNASSMNLIANQASPQPWRSRN
jgi:hypothetical protein